jgi:hypothetical protein
MKKFIDEKDLREILFDLLEYIQVVPVSLEILKKGLKSQHKDFEDAIQIVCASSIGKMDFIVTRNIKDFRDSEITVLTPEEACNLF